MPYYVHPSRSKDRVNSARVSFPTVVEARNAKRSGETVTFIANDDERIQWQYRERTRFTDGTYIRTPWADYFDEENNFHHWAHLSLKFPGKVAFTKSIEHGVQDRQTVMRPGRYLEQYFSDYLASDRERWIGIVSSLDSKLKIATTPDDIETVYRNGPNSCMSHSLDEYSSREHPVRVYGNSDLAIAYIGETIHDVRARAIVWPEKKIYGRIYGNEAVMRALLENAGFTRVSTDDYEPWRGAKIRRVKSGHSYLMPYLDIGETVDYHSREWWEVNGEEGEHTARNTNGLVGPDSRCEHCGEHCDEDETYCESCLYDSSICPDCDERNWDGHQDGYCDHCWQDYRECDKCGEVMHDDDAHYIEAHDEHFCSSCYDDADTCELCDERFIESRYSSTVRRNRKESLKGRVCHSCEVDGAFICETCNKAVEGGETCCDDPTADDEAEAAECAS